MLHGELKGPGLLRILDMLARSRQTGRLALAGGSQAKGAVYFQDGKVVHAETEDRAGPEALEGLLAWRDIYFEFQDGVSSPSEVQPLDLDRFLLSCQARDLRR